MHRNSRWMNVWTMGRDRRCYRAEPGVAAGTGGQPGTPPPVQAQQPAQAAPAQGQEDQITLTQKELQELIGQNIERAIQERFRNKNAVPPQIEKELVALRAENAKFKQGQMTEAQLLQAQRDELARQMTEKETEYTQKLSAAERRYLDQVLNTKIGEYASGHLPPGMAPHFTKAVRDTLKVDANGNAYGEDHKTGLQIPLDKFLDGWRSQPGNEMWNPPPGSGDGTRTGGPMVAPAVDLSALTPEQKIAIGYAMNPPDMTPLEKPGHAAANIPGRPANTAPMGQVVPMAPPTR